MNNLSTRLILKYISFERVKLYKGTMGSMEYIGYKGYHGSDLTMKAIRSTLLIATFVVSNEKYCQGLEYLHFCPVPVLSLNHEKIILIHICQTSFVLCVPPAGQYLLLSSSFVQFLLAVDASYESFGRCSFSAK